MWGQIAQAAAQAESNLYNLGLGIAGNIISRRNAKETNRTNIQIMREQNAFNEKMWNKNNEYNSPSAQMERDRQAGLNPYLRQAGQGSYTSDQVNAAPFAGAAQAQTVPFAQMQPIDLAGIMKTFADIEATKASTENQKIENKILASDANYRDTFNQQQVSKTFAELNLLDIQHGLGRQQYAHNQQIQPYFVEKAKHDAKIAEKTIESIRLANAITDKQLPWIEPKLRAEVANLIADTKLKRTQENQIYKENTWMNKFNSQQLRENEARIMSIRIDNLMKYQPKSVRDAVTMYTLSTMFRNAYLSDPSTSMDDTYNFDLRTFSPSTYLQSPHANKYGFFGNNRKMLDFNRPKLMLPH